MKRPEADGRLPGPSIVRRRLEGSLGPWVLGSLGPSSSPLTRHEVLDLVYDEQGSGLDKSRATLKARSVIETAWGINRFGTAVAPLREGASSSPIRQPAFDSSGHAALQRAEPSLDIWDNSPVANGNWVGHVFRMRFLNLRADASMPRRCVILPRRPSGPCIRPDAQSLKRAEDERRDGTCKSHTTGKVACC